MRVRRMLLDGWDGDTRAGGGKARCMAASVALTRIPDSTPESAEAGIYQREAALPEPALLRAADGRVISAGVATLTAGSAGWRVILRDLDRPGALVALYFGAGLRDVTIELAAERPLRGTITSTSFVDGRRVCEITGSSPPR